MEPTFRTPQEAIAYRAPRNAELEKDIRGLRGRVIEGGTWTESRFEYYLSNSKMLRFDVQAGKVHWTVSPRPQTVESPAGRDVDPVTLELRAGANQRPRRVLWDREAIFRTRIGRRFKKVVAGAACLWLYTEELSTLLYFSRLVQDPGQRDMLYWTEER